MVISAVHGKLSGGQHTSQLTMILSITSTKRPMKRLLYNLYGSLEWFRGRRAAGEGEARSSTVVVVGLRGAISESSLSERLDSNEVRSAMADGCYLGSYMNSG